MSQAVSAATRRRWRRYLGNERAEEAVYRELAARSSGDDREILLALAEAEQRHARHWRDLLGLSEADLPRADLKTRLLTWGARRFGTIFVLALAQRAETQTPYASDADATKAMAADELIHGEVVRNLAIHGRRKLSGNFRAAVFGANDGLVSNLALVLGIGATGVPAPVVLFTGIAGLLAGALSMAAGEYVSVSSQRELLSAAKPDPAAQAALPDLDLEANELALVYRARGMAEEDALAHARRVIRRVKVAEAAPSTGPIDHVHSADHEAVGGALGAAAASFAFFASGALVPVLPWLFGLSGSSAVLLAVVMVSLALLVTGAIVGLLAGASPLKRALRQLAIGLGAATATYLLGLAFGATFV